MVEVFRYLYGSIISKLSVVFGLLNSALALAFEWPWTSSLLLLAGALVVCGYIIAREHHRWKRGWLSAQIETRLSEAKERRSGHGTPASKSWRARLASLRHHTLEHWDRILYRYPERLRSDLQEWYRPSLLSSLLVAGAIAALFLSPDLPSPPSFETILNWPQSLFEDLSSDSKAGERISAAFTGLTVVVIALIVFVAESIRDNNDFDRKRTFLKASWLWPLGLIATLVPFTFLWSPPRRWTMLLELIIASATLFAFARVIAGLFEPATREKSRVALLRDRIRRVIFDSARERIGNNLLFEQIGPNKRISTFRFVGLKHWVKDEYILIDAPTDGWISDIQLDELQKLGERLDRYARELNFSVRSDQANPTASQQASTVSQSAPLPIKEAYILRRFREEIPPNSLFAANQRALFALPQDFAQNAALVSDIRASAPFIFRFTKDEPSSAAWRREMKATKDQLSSAIQSSSLGQVSELRLSYISIAEEFLELLAEYGGKYTAEQAKQERGNIFESWSEIGWLVSDLRELIEIACATNNRSVIGDIAFLPFAISSRAVHARDHFLFQQFFGFASLLYFLAGEKQHDKLIQEWLVDRSSSWPQDICQFYILPILASDDSTVEDLDDALSFAKHSLRVYQDLLKAAADNGDTKSFPIFLTKFEKLYQRLFGLQPQSPLIRIRLGHLEAGSDKELQKKRLLQAERRESIAAELNQAKYKILLALGGRVLARILAGESDENARQILELIQRQLPKDIDQITKTYAEAAGFSEADFWGWDQWDLIADGEAHFIDTFTNLNQMYALHAIRSLSAMPSASRSATELSPSDTLADLSGEQNSRGIIATLKKIEQNIETWQRVLPEDTTECIDALRSMLLAAAKKQKAIEEGRIRVAELDNSRVEKFKREVIEHFFETAQLRSIFSRKGIVEFKKEFSSQWLGYNQLDEKQAFIAEPQSSHVGWGQAYGEGLARSEDQDVFKQLIKAAGVRRKARPGTLVRRLVAQLERASSDQLILLHSLNYMSEQNEFERHSSFIRRYDPNLPPSEFNDIDAFSGAFVLNGTYHPMFRIYIQDNEFADKVLVIRPDAYMRWHQLVVPGTYEPINNVRDALSIEVIDLNVNSNLRNDVVKSKPDWLSSIENADAYLRGRVVIRVREAFRINIVDPKAGVCIDFSPP